MTTGRRDGSGSGKRSGEEQAATAEATAPVERQPARSSFRRLFPERYVCPLGHDISPGEWWAHVFDDQAHVLRDADTGKVIESDRVFAIEVGRPPVDLPEHAPGSGA